MKTFTTAFVAAASVMVANAHMVMRTPKPAGSPNNSPLAPDGSDFPCKIPGGSGELDKSNPNAMQIGASNTLSFTGSAVHGGGSCQVSMAKGTSISKTTKFMVIASFEGGCPLGGLNDNLESDPSGTSAATFPFTIPDHPDLGAGDYTLAWTWNNKIGNREFYMNCAYVQLEGAKKKRYEPTKPALSTRQQAPLPDIFVANIGNGCEVAENIDVIYPNPGSVLVVGASATLGKPTGNCGTAGAAVPANPAGSSAASSVVASSASAPASAGNTVQPTSLPAGGNAPSMTQGSGQYSQSQGGNFATLSGDNTKPTSAVSQATSAPAATQSAPVAPSAAVSALPSAAATKATSAVAPVATGASSGSPVSGAVCTEGDWDCAADGKSFKRCASLAWSTSIPMSAGLTCVPGVSANFAYNLSSTNAKRDLRSHIARRRHNLRDTFSS